MNFLLVFSALTLVLGANMSDGFLARLGLDPDVLTCALVAFVITGLACHRRLALLVLVVLMAAAANVPGELAADYGYDPDYLVVGLGVLVALPYIQRLE